MGASYPTFTNNSFTNNDVAAISIDPASLLTLSGNSATGNHPNAVDIRSGSITSSVTWDQSDLPYRLVGTVNVNLGSTLTIGPDMVFKGTSQQRLVISGGLDGQRLSRSSRLLHFLSRRHHPRRYRWGGSSSGSPADWGWIEFTPSSDDSSTISFAVIRYGGWINNIYRGNLYIQDASPTIQNCTIGNSTESGAYLTSSSMEASYPTFTNNSFTNNDVAAISIDPASLLTLSGNSATGNHPNAVDIRSGSITSSVTWDQSDLPYRLLGTVNVNLGATLTIGPDMVFKGTSQTTIGDLR